MIEISPSLLPVAKEHMLSYAEEAIAAGITSLHLDIIDGKFVNQYGLPDDIVQTILEQYHDQIDIHVHLMVNDPLTFIKQPHYRHASKIYVHSQADKQYEYILYKTILDIGCEPGIVINPNEAIDDRIDFNHFHAILLMGVVPGLSGQKILPDTITRIKTLRQFLLKTQPSHKYHLTLDGGVTKSILFDLNNQIDCCVMGAAIFNVPNWISELKQLLITMK